MASISLIDVDLRTNKACFTMYPSTPGHNVAVTNSASLLQHRFLRTILTAISPPKRQKLRDLQL
eukprot:764859-Hanusia_phi.AAC.2